MHNPPQPTIIQPDDTAWDAFVRQHPRAHILQLSAWGTLKATQGWRVGRIALTNTDGNIIAGAQWLLRALPFRLGTLAYLPYGGYVTHNSQWRPLLDAIQTYASLDNARFLKWEPGIQSDTPPDMTSWGFHISPHRVQPPRTLIIDITPPEDAIMARMNQGTRRKIRKSYKSDIHYYHATADDVARFSDLMQTTGERNQFGVHQGDYYRHAYDLFVPTDATLILAEHEGDLLAGNFVFGIGENAYYLYGASSNHKRDLMASYGVQWEGIQWAKHRGYRYYDMWGVPDEDTAILEANFQHRSDGLWGVYGFKRGWGGEIVRAVGTWDKPYNPLIYQAYRIALKLKTTSE